MNNKKTIGEIKLRRKNGESYSYRFKNMIGGTKHPKAIIISEFDNFPKKGSRADKIMKLIKRQLKSPNYFPVTRTFWNKTRYVFGTKCE